MGAPYRALDLMADPLGPTFIDLTVDRRTGQVELVGVAMATLEEEVGHGNLAHLHPREEFRRAPFGVSR